MLAGKKDRSHDKICSAIKKALKTYYFTTSIRCKNHTNVDRRDIWYKIYEDTIPVEYSTGIMLEKKNDQYKLCVLLDISVSWY